MEVSGVLSHPRYDCPTCIQFENYKARNCTGGPLIFHDTGVSIDRRNPPRAIPTPDRPAYRDGWADVAREASELGIKGFDEAFSGPDYFTPIDHCLRLYLAAPGVVEWLRLYAAISAGLRTPPTDAPAWYDRIMLAIHGAVTAHRGSVNG
jgi:hypothetical protein